MCASQCPLVSANIRKPGFHDIEGGSMVVRAPVPHKIRRAARWPSGRAHVRNQLQAQVRMCALDSRGSATWPATWCQDHVIDTVMRYRHVAFYGVFGIMPVLVRGTVHLLARPLPPPRHSRRHPPALSPPPPCIVRLPAAAALFETTTLSAPAADRALQGRSGRMLQTCL